MFDAKAFCHEYSIDYASSGRHYRRGWCNISCPFCQRDGHRLGINIEKGYGNCYSGSCGHHSLKSIISRLLNIPYDSANLIIIEYSTGFVKDDAMKTKQVEITLPIGLSNLKQEHYNYLKKRDFNPSIARFMRLKGTTHLSDDPWRIFIPVYQDHQLVNYQCRDITGKSDIKYKSCPNDKSIIDLKNTLYNADNVKNDSVIVVEGPMDTWRFKQNSVALFGTSWTTTQARMLSNRFKKIFIMFDPDEDDAQENAKKLYLAVTVMGCESEIITLNTGCDPGDLSDKQAKEILMDLGL